MTPNTDKPAADRNRPRRLAKEWDDYERRVLPIAAGEAQRTEMRRAFYAGAQAMMGVVMRSPLFKAGCAARTAGAPKSRSLSRFRRSARLVRLYIGNDRS